MNIKILHAKIQKSEENDVGYVAKFLNFDGSDLNYALSVIIGSHIDTFLRYICYDNYVKLVILDNRIIALADRDDNIELVRNIIFEGFIGREVNGNLKYIEETYGVSIDILESAIKEAIKDDYLEIKPVIVHKESNVTDCGVALSLNNENGGITIVCPPGTVQGNFVLKMAGVDTDMSEALAKIIGREMYVVHSAFEPLAIVDKETKEVCVLRTSYSIDGESANNSMIKELENRHGININNIDVRIKRLIDKEGRSN